MTKNDEQKIINSLKTANVNFKAIAKHLRTIYLYIFLLTLGFFLLLVIK